uniref:Alkylated DNA repair protein alkB homolog 8 (Trinotate prediction) n=1 Tax=Myxobolus squamalis TaxID=59785 RepID=A0A6B2G3Q8_MYXSQ
MLLSEIIRLLRINGTAMISFWAVEANDNKALAKSLSLVVEGSETAPSDLLVPWTETSNQTLNTQSTKYRYYHLYEHSEIVKLCEIFKSKIKIQDLFLDCGNWFLIIKKHSI